MIFRRPYFYQKPVWLPYAVILAVSMLIIALSIWYHNKEYAAKYHEELFITDTTVISNATHKLEHIQLPYTRMGGMNELLDFTIAVDYTAGTPAFFKIIPDDCVNKLLVNNKPVTLSRAMLEKHCDYRNGFMVDLKQYLKQGTNTVQVQVLNKGGLTGLKFVPVKVNAAAQ